MAEEQIEIAKQMPLFSEGMPEDNLQVESFGDDVLVGDPAMDEFEEQETEFTKRLPNIHVVEVFGWFILCIFAAGVMLMVLMFCSDTKCDM